MHVLIFRFVRVSSKCYTDGKYVRKTINFFNVVKDIPALNSIARQPFVQNSPAFRKRRFQKNVFKVSFRLRSKSFHETSCNDRIDKYFATIVEEYGYGRLSSVNFALRKSLEYLQGMG